MMVEKLNRMKRIPGKSCELHLPFKKHKIFSDEKIL